MQKKLILVLVLCPFVVGVQVGNVGGLAVGCSAMTSDIYKYASKSTDCYVTPVSDRSWLLADSIMDFEEFLGSSLYVELNLYNYEHATRILVSEVGPDVIKGVVSCNNGKTANERLRTVFPRHKIKKIALVVAGDESERYSRNADVELDQIDISSIETSADISPSKSLLEESRSVVFDVSGTYVSDITTNNNWRFRKAKDRKLVITIFQNGDKITGVNKSKNLKISGVIEGDNIRFFTWPSDISSDEIKGNWKINSDGTSLMGKWSHPHGGGIWNLTRVE